MAMYPKQVEEGVAPLRGQAPPPPPPATGFPMNGGGGYYQAGGATAARAVHAQAPVAAWSTGLCNCFDDCGNCEKSMAFCNRFACLRYEHPVLT